MNRALYMALLAMDSYNRGYARRLRMNQEEATDSSDNNDQLGNATIIRQSDTRSGTSGVDSNFYAIAYEWQGETIISYRGTDEFVQDAVNGYSIGAGFTGIFASEGDEEQSFAFNVSDPRFCHKG